MAADETQALWREYAKSKDQGVRDRLILTYAPLVKYVAGRLGSGLPAHVDENDLVSYGLLGLIGAIERFDPNRDIKFETYAIARIKGSIIDELRAMDWVPRSVRSRARDIERAIGELERKLHRAPTDEEIAEKLGVSTDDLNDNLKEIGRSSIAALDELWTISSGTAETRSPDRRGHPGRSRNPGRRPSRRRWARRSPGFPNARSSWSRSTTTGWPCVRSAKCSA
jgi:RNA polymerase sigma factor for flagellar operon FliA